MEKLEVVIIVSMLALLVWAVVGALCFRYWPAGDGVRQRMHGQTVHHYVPEEHLEFASGVAAVRSRPGRHATMNVIRGPVAFYYLGRNGRGARMNHRDTEHASYARVDIDGADFLAWLGDRPLWFRPLDLAMFVKATYIGPARVTRGVRPRKDRSLR